QSVALISHVPQLVSSMLAARLADAPVSALSLSGQGLRDTTRIAASDPRLWTAILAGNAGPVVKVLKDIRGDLDDLISHLDAAAQEGPLEGGSIGAVYRVMDQGNRGVARIPGKHGGAPTRYVVLDVFVPDTAGSLGRLFADLGEIGVNIEDFALEHSTGAQMGVARLSLDPSIVASTICQLQERGWNTGSGD
ncbi:MAG: prephenate dehydrogenase/arogenate dehydrogenase family protein, partial [Actinomyces sp.]|nr:prephenate dehydrogenase/arogenate dehydrogenase family protein [Actinomyces sp.]